MVRLPLLLVILSFVFTSHTASADFYSHLYGGISLQRTAQTDYCSDTSQAVASLNFGPQVAALDECSDTGAGIKLYGGKRWSPYFAIEADARQMATSKASLTISNPVLTRAKLTSRLRTRMGNAFFVGHVPLRSSKFSLFGKLGGGFWSGKQHYKESGEATTVFRLPDGSEQTVTFPLNGTYSDTSSGFHWGYGAGMSYRLENSWTLRAEWERFPKLGNEEVGGKYQMESMSLGWSMHF